MEPVKGSREISLQNAALRQAVSHGVSFRRLPSYTLSRCAGLPLKGKQDVTGLPSCFLSTHAKHSAELATFGGSPLSHFAGLSPRESVSHDSQVALLPYSTAITDSQYFARHCVPSKYVRWCDSCSLATPSGEQNKPLYVPPQSHVAHWQASIVPPAPLGWQRNWSHSSESVIAVL